MRDLRLDKIMDLNEKKKELQKNTFGSVYFIDEFCDLCESGCITDYDGFGYFLSDDGIESDLSVFNPKVTTEYAEKYNFVVWYNK